MADQAATGEDGGKLGQILAAARHVFLEEGYAAATMDAVAKRAGVSKATLYAYFEGKEALFKTMVKIGQRALAEAIATNAATSAPGDLETLRDAGLRFLRYVTSQSSLTLFRAVIGEAQRFPELGRLIFDAGRSEILDIFIEALRRCDAAGTLRVPDPDAAARQYLALVKADLQLRCLLDPNMVATEEQLSTNVDNALALLKSHYRAA